MDGRGLTRTMVIWVPDWPVAAAAVATGRSPDEPIVVRADAVRIAQVVINLLNNAVAYTGGNGQI